jgi:FtsP/CotA-like multicopper oxidase with cupredoxin domain
VLALDGQPVRQPADADRIVLAPGQRVDLLLDCLHPPGSRFDVLDHGEDAERSTRVAALRYGPARRPAPLREPVVLPANPLPAPDLAHAVRCPIVLGGGAMGQLTRARLEGEELDMAQLLARGRVWALNGVVGSNLYHFDAPLMRLRQGQTGLLSVVNETAWAHPVHLHGFPVVELTPEGQIGLWRDTVLLQPGARRPRFRGRAPRPVDVPLSHPRASGWRHDGIH